MIKNIKCLNEFAINNGVAYIVELPLFFDGGVEEMIKALTRRYEEYIKLLKDFVFSVGGDDLDDIILDIKLIYNCFLNVVKDKDTYPILTTTLNKINSKYQLFDIIKKPLNTKHLYRFCSYSAYLTEAKEFYHCPIMHGGSNTRFGRPDNYLWYLGLSKEVCKYEARGNTGSLATFVKSEEINSVFVIDLTQDGLFDDDTSFEKKCYIFWWLLVCCYCVAENEVYDNVTYTFPQLFSQYIKDNYPNIAGIKYYTVRNKKLNPDEKTYINVALFTKDYNAEGYDMNLCGKFEMIECQQNVKSDIL